MMKEYKEITEEKIRALELKVISYKAQTDSLRMTKVNQFRRYRADLKEVEFDVTTLKNQVKAINDKIGGYKEEKIK